MLIDMTQITVICSPTILMDFSIKRKSKKGLNKVEEFTFPTKSIGIKKEGTAETNPKSRYSNSVNLCQLP